MKYILAILAATAMYAETAPVKRESITPTRAESMQIRPSAPAIPSVSPARTVHFHGNAGVERLQTGLNYTTLVILPKEEKIMEVTCGDKDDWQINWSDNFASIKPSIANSRTNVNLRTTAGNIYTFLPEEVSTHHGATIDIKVIVEQDDSSALVNIKHGPRYVPVDELDQYKRKADEAIAAAKQAQDDFHKQLETERAKLQATYPATIKHDYEFLYPNKLGIVAIYHDASFTFIEKNGAGEIGSVYETKDGKPSLVQYEFDKQTNRYVIPKILDDGYVAVGKKTRVDFKRVSQ